MSTPTSWTMLKDALRGALDELPGYRVSHALFTTYAFEPEFLEASILPQLLPDAGEGLSLHGLARRLQMESLLRDAPMPIDVYFDARVAIPGCPLLPYNMIPVRLGHEFHAKIMLLRLQEPDGQVRCLLGAGSANLTQAGWWENIEAWYFAPVFDPAHPPANLLPGIRSLFRVLEAHRPAGGTDEGEDKDQHNATQALQAAFEDAIPIDAAPDAPVFGVFGALGHDAAGERLAPTFADWLDERLQAHRTSEARLEVISPYFAESRHDTLIRTLLETTASPGVDLWLPVDPWQAGGPTCLLEDTQFDELGKVTALRWAGFRDDGLSRARQADRTPRFLHAKLIRQPGRFCFMGSVNFSHKAFGLNFEAGFIFPDKGAPWLTPLPDEAIPQHFQKPAETACHDDADAADASLPEVHARFNWQTLRLSLGIRSADSACTDVPVEILDAQAAASGLKLSVPGSGTLELPRDAALHQSLQTNPWIRLRLPDGRHVLAWVQQEALAFRPLPADLTPGAWRILEMWRSLSGGAAGSGPINVGPLEIILKRRGEGGSDSLDGTPEQDIFGVMAEVHGSFYVLRQRLREAARDHPARLDYYLAAPRPDALPSMLERIARPPAGELPVDAVAAWVMLLWIIQICSDHPQIPAATALSARAGAQLELLLASAPLNALDAKFLHWAAETFLSPPEQEMQP